MLLLVGYGFYKKRHPETKDEYANPEQNVNIFHAGKIFEELCLTIKIKRNS
jgi:hypothetical protein